MGGHELEIFPLLTRRLLTWPCGMVYIASCGYFWWLSYIPLNPYSFLSHLPSLCPTQPTPQYAGLKLVPTRKKSSQKP